EIGEARRALERDSASKDKVKREAANRALAWVDDLRDTLRGWYNFYDGYDPGFTWWVQEPYKGVDEGLQSYADFLRQKLGAVTTGLGGGFGPGPGRRRGAGSGPADAARGALPAAGSRTQDSP